MVSFGHRGHPRAGNSSGTVLAKSYRGARRLLCSPAVCLAALPVKRFRSKVNAFQSDVQGFSEIWDNAFHETLQVNSKGPQHKEAAVRFDAEQRDRPSAIPGYEDWPDYLRLLAPPDAAALGPVRLA